MPERYWLVHPNGGRQLIDPGQFDLDRLAEQARRIGGRLVVEGGVPPPPIAPPRPVLAFEPPVSALGPMFRLRLARVHTCLVDFSLDMNVRATVHVLGGYYSRQRLVRVYTHDRVLGRRPMEELFDTFLHETAHHIEYTEPQTFNARSCGRVHGCMHSALFWRILGELKGRWSDEQYRTRSIDAQL
jgi:hypothetical protein